MEQTCQILVRSKQALELYPTPEKPEDAVPATGGKTLLEGLTTILHAEAQYCYAHLVGVGIVKLAYESNETVTKATAKPFLANTAPVQMFDVSPLGNYLLTWERWSADQPHNLKVWDAQTGDYLAGMTQRNLKREGWPYLQWTHDEQYGLLMASGEVHVYTPTSIRTQRYIDKMRLPGVQYLSLPRKSDGKAGYLFATFVGGSKDKPARASLHEYLPDSKATGNYPSLQSKSLFQAEEMKAHWSPNGDSCVITLQTSVDASGQSYYGSSQLYMLAPHAIEAVPLPQDGPVLDVQWCPVTPPCFVVMAGRMPSLTSLHHGQNGKATFLFGNAHRNTVSWAPHGRFVCLAGFGNLAGGMGFWDKNKGKLIPHYAPNVDGSLRADAVVGHGWAPSSRSFLVSTCSPRMNVDNGVRLFRYTGQELTNVSWNNDKYRPDKLLEACFVPSNFEYPDRPQSPMPESGPIAGPVVSKASSTGSASTAAAAAPKPAGRYVPPSMRNRAGGNAFADRMRAEREGTVKTATRVKDTPTLARNAATGKVIPGMAVDTGAKSKSAQKREKQKLKQKQEQEAARKAEEARKALEEQAASEPVQVDPEKRARKLKKTLKQIEDLKAKDPSELNDDQKEKIASEGSLREELASLNL